MKEVYDGKRIREFFDIWPANIPDKSKWRVRIESFLETQKRLSCWKNKQGRRFPIRWFAEAIETKDWSGKRHQIRSLARFGGRRHPVVLVDSRGIIFDGNHLCCALWLIKYQGDVLLLEEVK